MKSHWPDLAPGSRVLVPLCGKSPDLIWLVDQGLDVVGVELSDIAARQFFADNDLDCRVDSGDQLDRYVAKNLPLEICCGDYFEFDAEPFDALYDRGALVAIPGDMRESYVEHTRRLLQSDAARMVITLEYDQSVVQGPPFSVSPNEMLHYWRDLKRVAETNDIDNCPPKFRAAGLREIQEVVWLGVMKKGAGYD